MGTALLLSVLLGSGLGADTVPALSGTIRADGIHWEGPLVGAIVEVRQGALRWSAAAGSEGRYRLEGLQAGPVSLAVHHLAADPFHLDVRLPESGEVRLDLVLSTRVVALPGVEVHARSGLNRDARPRVREDPAGRELALRALLESSGMAESGMASVLAGEESRGSDRVFYMRGSTVDARMVFLDGAPVLTPFHVAGLVEPFDLDLLGEADLYLGGAPSTYDGGVSYLLDVATRPIRRDRVRGGITADGISLRGFAEVPLPGDGGLLMGGRNLHGLQGRLGQSDHFPYKYDDFLVRMGWDLFEGHAIRLTGFHNQEGVRLDLAPDLPGRPPRASWGNRVASLGYDGGVGSVRLQGTAATSRYSSVLPVPWEDPVLAAGIGERGRLFGQADVPVETGTVRVGGSMERIRFRYGLDPLELQWVSTMVLSEERRATTAAGLFAEWDGWLSEDLHLRAGLRADHFSHEGRVRWGPRLALRFRLGESARLVASGGGYHQVLPAPGLHGDHMGDAPALLDWRPTLPVASASHLVLGLEQELDHQIEIGLSGFVKGFSGLGPEGDERSRASGTELRVSWEAEDLRAWLGYAISWFWLDEGMGGTTRFDGRHLLSLGMMGTLPVGLELSGTLGYGAGLPLTAIELADASTGSQGEGSSTLGGRTEIAPTTEQRLNAGGGVAPLEVAPQDDFLRLDLEVGWPREVRMGSRDTRLRPYLKVLNALDRRDALFYYFDRWRGDDVRPLVRRSFLPVVGIDWRF